MLETTVNNIEQKKSEKNQSGKDLVSKLSLQSP